MQTVWISAFADGKGIYRDEVIPFKTDTSTMISPTRNIIYEKGEWHYTKPQAELAAVKILEKELKLHQQEIERLKKKILRYNSKQNKASQKKTKS